MPSSRFGWSAGAVVGLEWRRRVGDVGGVRSWGAVDDARWRWLLRRTSAVSSYGVAVLGSGLLFRLGGGALGGTGRYSVGGPLAWAALVLCGGTAPGVRSKRANIGLLGDPSVGDVGSGDVSGVGGGC